MGFLWSDLLEKHYLISSHCVAQTICCIQLFRISENVHYIFTQSGSMVSKRRRHCLTNPSSTEMNITKLLIDLPQFSLCNLQWNTYVRILVVNHSRLPCHINGSRLHFRKVQTNLQIFESNSDHHPNSQDFEGKIQLSSATHQLRISSEILSYVDDKLTRVRSYSVDTYF